MMIEKEKKGWVALLFCHHPHPFSNCVDTESVLTGRLLREKKEVTISNLTIPTPVTFDVGYTGVRAPSESRHVNLTSLVSSKSSSGRNVSRDIRTRFELWYSEE